MTEALDSPNINIKTEEEVFEITDFTNSSDWERFIAQIEEKIADWHLNGYVKLHALKENELTTGEWEALTTNLNFTGVPFTMTLHRLKEKEDTEQFVEEDDEDEETLQLPQYIEDMMNTNNDFPARAHCLARWFGLRCFLLISIASTNGVMNESKCNLLTSSISIALSNTSCDVPFFVQVQENWRKMYEGHAVSSGISTNFEMVHLKKCPNQYKNVSGLMHVFKHKVGLRSQPTSWVAARFTYILRDWGLEGRWPAKPPDSEALAKRFGSLPSGAFEDPVGDLQLAVTWPSRSGSMIIDNDTRSEYEPLKAPCWSIRLCYADDVFYLMSSFLYEFFKIADRSESMSDLLNVLHDEPERDIGQALNRITDPSNTVLPIVPAKLASGITKVVTDPHSLIRKSAYTIGRIAAVRERISRDVLNDIKSYLFFKNVSENENLVSQRPAPSQTFTFCHRLKAAPVDSLTHRVAMSATVVNMCHGGLAALAQLWHLFVSELRALFDSGTLLPGIEMGKPDLGTCLLHQKLQMLNCCINLKKQREERKSSSSMMRDMESWASFQTAVTESPNAAVCGGQGNTDLAATQSNDDDEIPENHPLITTDLLDSEQAKDDKGKSGENAARASSVDNQTSEEALSETRAKRVFSVHSEDSDDEFFECESTVNIEDSTNLNRIEILDDQKEPREEDAIETENTSETVECEDSVESEREVTVKQVIDDSYSPEGRLSVHETLRLLRFDRPLYIPVTQDHAPVTEDLLEEQADVFSKLGDTKEGSRVRAKMQSASLLSDMEAFKAANPGCCLEDFVRWYSPRDFEDGKLSPRMLIPHNLWVTSWTSAKPAPVTRQKRIFDDTKEGEKVLHFLTNLKPGEVAQLLLPICTHEALLALRLASESMVDCLPSLPLICSQVESKASHLFRSWRMFGPVSNQFVPWTKETRSAVDDIFRQISFVESLVERARSLQHKFSKLGNEAEINKFVRKLLEHPEVQLDKADEGKDTLIVREYFMDQQKRLFADEHNNDPTFDPLKPKLHAPLPEPTGREFIIRATHAYPTSGSRELPHRLYAVLMQGEFRLASAVSSDTTFF